MKKAILGASAALTLMVPLAYADSQLLPPTSDGAYTQWTPKSGAVHYTQVNETPCNGTISYNSTNTVGARDSYGIYISGIPNGAKITQIDITPCASKNANGGGNSTLNVFYRLDGVNSSDAGSYSLSGTKPVDLAATSYSDLAIIKGVSTSLEAGAVLSAGTKGARLSRIVATVTYAPLAAPSNLGATATSSSEIDLVWTDNSSFEGGFIIERSNLTASSTFAAIATTTANATNYADLSVASSTHYGYRVRAFNTGGYSSYSNTASTTTP